MKYKLKLVGYILLIILLFCSYLFFRQAHKEYLAITNFETCVTAGYKVIPTYPEQCKIPGKIFMNTAQVASPQEQKATSTLSEKKIHPRTISYGIDGEILTLEDTTSEASSTKNTLRYFGNELRIDLNGDTKEDSAFIVTSSNSGTGTFYYLVVALNNENGYIGTNGVFIGDRIAPQTTEYRNGEIVVNYADRKLTDPMTAQPSIGVSRFFKVVNNTLVEISK